MAASMKRVPCNILSYFQHFHTTSPAKTVHCRYYARGGPSRSRISIVKKNGDSNWKKNSENTQLHFDAHTAYRERPNILGFSAGLSSLNRISVSDSATSNNVGLSYKSKSGSAANCHGVQDESSDLSNKLAPDDKAFRRTVEILKHRARRHRERITSLEGTGAICQAVKDGIRIRTVYYNSGVGIRSSLEELPLKTLTEMGTNFCNVSREQLLLICGASAVSNSTVVGICEIPASTDPKLSFHDRNRLPISIIADNIRDPGNMSMLLTSSVATACQNMFVTKGCIDIWDPKVMRSANCSQFNVPIFTDMTWKVIDGILPTHTQFFLANNCTAEYDGQNIKSTEYHNVDYTAYASVAIVIGGETEGLSVGAYNLCRSRGGLAINIPMLSGIDSLNSAIAGGVIIFEMARQFRRNVSGKKSETQM